MLELRGVSKSFGGVSAVEDVDLEVRRGEIVGLIGPNGAGKTTLFNLIAGVFKPTRGTVKFQGKDITGQRPHRVSRAGIARTFQIVKPFGNLSVLENVMVGAFHQGPLPGAARREAARILKMVGLARRADVPARTLTIGERKRLELARALAIKPQLLMIDEVMAGLNPKETQETMALVRAVRDQGLTVLMIEHNMTAVMSLSD
ncbi:MAG: ABC transporter ATP-binding protein, partial [Actinobacteria bacterium]|nr:ABC transporter ATP-binding protein [Actinomycetota bacterium]